MTVVDTFTLDFKTNIPQAAQKDVAALDKQIDELAKKGKKRDEDESKRYDTLRKQRKQVIDDIKEQQRETDKLHDSFSSMIQTAVGAGAAFVSFSALKAGLIDANNLNNAFKILSQTYGSLQPQQTKALGIAFERSTGIQSDVMVGFLTQAAATAQAKGIPFNPATFLRNISNQARRSAPGMVPLNLSQVAGINSVFPFLQKSQAEQDQAYKEGFGLAGKPEDFNAAQENQKAVSKTRQAYQELATEIDTHFMDAIKHATDALQGLAGILKGHPNITAAAGGGLALGTSLGIYRALGWLGKLISGGGAAVSGEGTAAVGAAGASLSEVGLWGMLIPSLDAKMKRNIPAYRKLTGGASSSNKSASLAFWQSQGYTAAQAAGWAANEQAESSFNPAANNGSHGGIFQWSASRRAKILKALGIDVWNASHADQLRAAAWEASQMGLGPLGLSSSAGGAATDISNKFEVPSTNAYGLLQAAQSRAGIANGIYSGIPFTGGAGGGSRTNSIKIDNITVNTQATDASGIAAGLSAEMKKQLDMVIANFDDGQYS